MKTNVVMVRKLKNFEILQRTQDSMFNATALLNQWNKELRMSKEMMHFFDNEGTKQFIEVLEEEEFGIPRNSELPSNQSYIRTKCKTDKRGFKTPGETWMHPILFIKFAMWLNPRFEYHVIRFVYDNLIAFRHDAGDNYRELTAAASKFPNTDYSMLAKGLNYVVFGQHYAGIRQKATEAQLGKLNYVQKYFATGIDMGTIKSFDQLMAQIRMMYELEHKKIA